MFKTLVVFILLFGLSLDTHASTDPDQTPVFDSKSALAISQAAIGNTVGDYRFLDRRGRVVNLAGLRGQPLVVSLIYTSCFHICSALNKQLAQVADIAREALGGDSFSVLIIGFDSVNDIPERMASYARNQGIDDEPNWYFLSADTPTSEHLSEDLGFVYFPSPRGFDHTAQITLLDQQGRVYRHIYGDYLQTQALVEPLKQLVFGRPAEAATLDGWLNGVRLLCTVYDPNSGRYTFDYSIFVGAAIGFICLSGVAVFVIRAWRQSSVVS